MPDLNVPGLQSPRPDLLTGGQPEAGAWAGLAAHGVTTVINLRPDKELAGRDEALKRIDFGTYGVCEMSGKPIAHARLEALPFARYTVECQSQIEKQGKVTRARVPVTSLFGLTDEEGGSETEEEEPATESKE